MVMPKNESTTSGKNMIVKNRGRRFEVERPQGVVTVAEFVPSVSKTISRDKTERNIISTEKMVSINVQSVL